MINTKKDKAIVLGLAGLIYWYAVNQRDAVETVVAEEAPKQSVTRKEISLQAPSVDSIKPLSADTKPVDTQKTIPAVEFNKTELTPPRTLRPSRANQGGLTPRMGVASLLTQF